MDRHVSILRSVGQVQDDDQHLQILPEVILQTMSDRNLDAMLDRVVAEREERQVEDDPLPAYTEVEDREVINTTTDLERARRRRLGRQPQLFREGAAIVMRDSTTTIDRSNIQTLSGTRPGLTDGPGELNSTPHEALGEPAFDHDGTYIGVQWVNTSGSFEVVPSTLTIAGLRTCGICNFDLQQASATSSAPLQLGCGHIFCLDCLSDYTEQEDANVGLRVQLPCPACHTDNCIPIPGALRLEISQETWNSMFLPLTSDEMETALPASVLTKAQIMHALRRTMRMLWLSGMNDPLVNSVFLHILHSSSHTNYESLRAMDRTVREYANHNIGRLAPRYSYVPSRLLSCIVRSIISCALRLVIIEGHRLGGEEQSSSDD